MNFNSLHYFIFLPIVVGLYFLLPTRMRNPMLLAASYYFYMCWQPVYAILIAFSTVITYLCARLMDASWLERKKLWLLLSFGLNLAILFFFKYFNFAADTLARLMGLAGMTMHASRLDILLPVGISFYTFQALGYTMDVYRGEAAQRSIIDYALFIAFFPQLVAGPIERSENILPQLKVKQRFAMENVRQGVILFLWGLFKKMVISDNLAILVNTVYGDSQQFGGLSLLIATVAFAVQIYCDFSAYSDIARGSAAFLGIKLMRNFNAPYFAESIKDFWRRWHISLSTWFKDYLYIPLGGSRRGVIWTCINIMIVFVASGLWHGAAMTFLVWGALNGMYQVIGTLWKRLSGRRGGAAEQTAPGNPFARMFKILFTFMLTCLAWVFFRANSVAQAMDILRAVLTMSGGLGALQFSALGLSIPMLGMTAAAMVVLVAVDLWQQHRPALLAQFSQNRAMRYAACLSLLIGILVFGYYGSGYNPLDFIYFQF